MHLPEGCTTLRVVPDSPDLTPHRTKMKRFPLWKFAIFLYAVVQASLASLNPANAQTAIPLNSASGNAACVGAIDVHVVEAFDHEPIVGAYVMANGAMSGITDQQGHLVVVGICSGKVTLEILHDAFETSTRILRLKDNAAVEVALAFKVEEYNIETKAPPSVDMRSTAVVSAEVIERKRGQSFSEVLAEVPGVTQLRSGSGVAKPIVRGHFGRRLPLIVDGVRHRAQDWGLDHAPEIDPAMADRITVVRGASGVRYGSDAIGGVVLVDPPTLRKRPGVEGETHRIVFSNGLGGNFMGRVQAVSATMPALSVQLEGSLRSLSAPSTPDYALDNTGESEMMGGATVEYRAGDASYKLSYRHLQAELGVCSCFRMDSASDFLSQLQIRRPIGSELYSSEFKIERPYQAVAHDLALARGRWTVGSTGTLTATYALQYDDRREYDIVRQAVSGPQYSFRLLTHDADITLEHKPIHLSDHHHLIGSIGAVGMVQTHSYRGLQLVPNHHAESAGIFASERFLADEFEIEAGVRYDLLARTADLLRGDFLRLVRSGQLENDACNNSQSDAERIKCVSMYHTVSASLGAMFHVATNWSTKIDLSMAARPPNPDEQYLNGTAPSLPVFGLGKPDLRPETSYSASMTTSYAGPSLTAEASVFGNLISNYIYFAPAIGSDNKPVFDVLIRGAYPRFITRAVDAVFYGADGSVSATPVRWLELGTQLSMVRAKNINDGSFLVFVPSDNARASVRLKRNRLWSLGNPSAALSGSYTARQTRFDPAADLASPPDAYFVAAGSLEADAPVMGHVVRLALAGSNLMAQRYREYTSLMRYFADQPGRQIWLRMSVKF